MEESGDEDTVFRDLLALLLLGFVAIIVLIIPFINPPVANDDAAAPAGNIIVEARWPDELDVDVDVWIKAPMDRPVGFSSKHGIVFDLLRDDLGVANDDTGLNYEFAFSRGAPPGGYVVNVHWYSNVAGADTVTVVVVVSLASGADAKPVKLYSGKVTLQHVGHEVTVVRFTLDEQGRVVPGSVHSTPVGLKVRAQ